MKKYFVVGLIGATTFAPALALAKGDVVAGETKSTTCAACHGATGISSNELWPHLAGQGYTYLVKQMKAFRDGTRKDPVMEVFAKPLSDADVEDLAAYFSSIGPARGK